MSNTNDIRNVLSGRINQDISQEVRTDVRKMPKAVFLVLVAVVAFISWFFASRIDTTQVYEGTEEVKIYESVEQLVADSDMIVEVSNANDGNGGGLSLSSNGIEKAASVSVVMIDKIHKNTSGVGVIPNTTLNIYNHVYYDSSSQKLYRINKDFLMHNQGKYLLFLKKGSDPRIDSPFFEPLSIVYGKVVLSEPEDDSRPNTFRTKQPENIQKLHDAVREKYGK